MARRRGERYIAGAYTIGALPLGGLRTPIKPPTLAVLSVPHPAASITAFTPKTGSAALAAGLGTVALKPPASSSSLATAGTAALKPTIKPNAPAKPLAPTASPASLAQATASANKLIAAGRRTAGKRRGAAMGQKAVAAGQSLLAAANHAAASAAHRVMGEILGVDWGKVGTTALDFSAYFQTQAGTNDALAAMVDAGGRAMDVVDALTAVGQTSAAAQGQSIIDAMNNLLSSPGITANDDLSNIQSADTSIGPKANALVQQENYWETGAAPLAGMTGGGAPPPSGGTTTTGAVPTITAVSDVSNPSGNMPPQPNPYGGMPAGGANPGDQVSITGKNLTGATTVMFSGVPAMAFQVVSPTQITATVPQGAPTGPVTVTTPGGVATSPGVIYMNAASSMYSDPYGGAGGGYGGGGGGGGYGGDSGGGGGALDDSDIDWGDGQYGGDPGQGMSDADIDWGDGGGGGLDDGGGADYGYDGGGFGGGYDDASYASYDDAGIPGDADFGGSGIVDNSEIDWGDGSSSGEEDVMGDNRYVVGAQVIGADWNEIVGDAVPHAPFDNKQIYNPGDIVSYWGQWWKATRQVVPPLVPSLMKGDVPGGNDAWLPLTAEEVITDVLGAVAIPTAGANYTDKKTVAGVQAALNDKGFKGKDGKSLKVDGLMGPNTAYAIRAAQSAADILQTGIIDEGVIAMLQVTPGVLPPGVTLQQKTDVEVQAVLDAATAVEHAVTQPDVQAAAAQVAAAAPAEPPELKQEAVAAHAAAVAATTPAQVAIAKQQVQAVAKKVTAAVVPGWWGSPLWAGAPIKRWQGVVGGGAAVAVGLGLALVARRR